MVFNFRTFDPEDEYLNNHPGSPIYYGPSFSSSDSSSAVDVCSGWLGGCSSGLFLLHPESSDAGQRFSSPVQVPQSQNRGRDGNGNFFSILISRRIRGDGSKSLQEKKLVVFDNWTWALGLEDLLKAPAEVLWKEPRGKEYASSEHWLRAPAKLGEGLLWTTYKASVKDSTAVVIKRLKKNGNVTIMELREHMELIGQIRHENVAPLQAYMISRDEGLMLYDYYSQGSVYSMMHGDPRRSLSWELRQKILLGAARGIAYIHEQNGGKLCHGNLTSSNVFINTQGYGCVSEICCNTLKSGESPYSCYNPNMREASQTSDIYRLGLLMLELLTGENPWMADAASSIISKVYYHLGDDTLGFPDGLPRDECMPMLHLALRCVMDEADKRPKIEELVEQVENNVGWWILYKSLPRGLWLPGPVDRS